MFTDNKNINNKITVDTNTEKTNSGKTISSLGSPRAAGF